MTGLEHAKGGTTLGSYAYGYDAKDQLISATVPTATGSNTTDYAYDDTDQLTSAEHTAQTDETYVYDTIVRTGTPSGRSFLNFINR